MPLTSQQLMTLRPGPNVRKLFDGGGLHLVLTPRGRTTWRLAYRFDGRTRTMRIGRFPEMSLAQARRARVHAKRLLRKQVDPRHAETQRERARRLASGATFREVGEEWLQLQTSLSASTVEGRRVKLEKHLFPELGSRPIDGIEPLDVLDALRRIERRGHPRQARRLLGQASTIFRYGVVTSRCRRDPTVDLVGALRPMRPGPGLAALPARELPEFFARLGRHRFRKSTRQAFQLLMLTFVRPYELRLAAWREFEDLDGEAPTWRIPAARMKMRRPHVVPLSPQAVAVLAEARRISGDSPYVFPSCSLDGVISHQTLPKALRDMGYVRIATPHGFRKLASTVLNEHQFNADWIEVQLSHRQNSIRNIYNAADWLPGRRRMMCWWGDYLACAAAAGGFPLPGPAPGAGESGPGAPDP